jgi:hypothetical protein
MRRAAWFGSSLTGKKNWRDSATTHLRLDRSSSLTFAELARTMQPEEEEAAAALGARSHGCTGAKKVRGSIQASSSPCVASLSARAAARLGALRPLPLNTTCLSSVRSADTSIRTRSLNHRTLQLQVVPPPLFFYLQCCSVNEACAIFAANCCGFNLIMAMTYTVFCFYRLYCNNPR